MRPVETCTKTGRKSLKRPRSSPSSKMPVTDADVSQNQGRACYIVPRWGNRAIAFTWLWCTYFCPDDSLIAYLFCPNHTLSREVYAFDLDSGKHELAFSPPYGGLDERNISEEEKLRRERSRERGLGATRYEWVKMGSSKKKVIMVPLPLDTMHIILLQNHFGSIHD